MRRRALVLGAGGPVAVAWEHGVIAGLAECGVELQRADLIVGTSAGAIVGAQLARGLVENEEPRTPAPPPTPEDGIPLPQLTSMLTIWTDRSLAREERCRRLGALARTARTASEQAWRAAVRPFEPCEGWPPGDLRLMVVDVDSGKRVQLTAKNAPLESAVTASCAIPGWGPIIEIEGHRYMDGVAYSSTHADVALEVDPESVVVLAPLVHPGIPEQPALHLALYRELAELERAGVPHVCAVTANEADAAAFGPDMASRSRAAEARKAGLQRGQELAAALRATW